MPNIEIHGYGIRGSGILEPQDVQDLRNRIFALIETPHHPDVVADVVVTIFDDYTIDECGCRQPFLRVVSTPSPHLDEIVELLKALNIDIEVLMLSAFYPKKSASAG